MKITRASRGNEGNWWKRHLFLLIVVPCSLVIVAGGVVSGLILLAPEEKVAEEEPEEPPEVPKVVQKYFSHLTGQEVESEAMLNKAATCVMIENSTNARPQSGLRAAGVVHEAIAEGGITRFMAVYQDAMPDLIGPVRSVRMHYAEWAKPYNCSVAHVGGSDDALAAVRNRGIGYRDIDQFFNGVYYWRSRDRAAPHNVYTNAENLNNLNAAKGYTTSDFAGLARATKNIVPTRSDVLAVGVAVNLSSADWNSSFVYDATTNKYLRSHQRGGAHMDKDANGVLTQNAPDVVVVMRVTDKPRPGGAYRNMETIGTGVAHIFQNGEYIAGSWSKASVDTELSFVDANGSDVVLNRGQVWIVAVPTGGSVSWE